MTERVIAGQTFLVFASGMVNAADVESLDFNVGGLTIVKVRNGGWLPFIPLGAQGKKAEDGSNDSAGPS